MVPLAIGTQTNGSVIRPASFCGIVGFKPTFGTIARTGILPQATPLDTVGVFARSVADAALLVDALAGRDPADPDSSDHPPSGLLDAALSPPATAPSFAFVRTPSWPVADDATKAAFEALGREAGRCLPRGGAAGDVRRCDRRPHRASPSPASPGTTAPTTTAAGSS